MADQKDDHCCRGLSPQECSNVPDGDCHQEMANTLKAAGWQVRPPVDQNKCPHLHKDGIGSAGSDGSSSFTGRCLDCGKDLSYSIKGQLADPMLQLQPRN